MTENEKVILLLGEIKSGKTTLINSLFNYVKHDDMNTKDVELPIGIHLSLIHTDDYVIKTVSLGPEEDRDNEKDEIGHSVTQDPRVYKLEYENCKYVIIDTPGIGDCDGMKKDNLSMKKIVNCVALYKDTIHICIVMDANCSNKSVENFFDIIFSYFKDTSSYNFVFCFTKTRRTGYSVGDNFTFIKQTLPSNIQDKLNLKSIFCVDNEGMKHALVLSCPDIDDDYKNDLKTFEKEARESWKKSVIEIKRLLTTVAHHGSIVTEPSTIYNSLKQDKVVLDKTSVNKQLDGIFEEIEKNHQEAHKRELENLQKALEEQLKVRTEELETFVRTLDEEKMKNQKLSTAKDLIENKLKDEIKQMELKMETELKRNKEQLERIKKESDEKDKENKDLHGKLKQKETESSKALNKKDAIIEELEKKMKSMASSSKTSKKQSTSATVEEAADALEEVAVDEVNPHGSQRTTPANAKINFLQEDRKRKAEYIRGFLSRPIEHPDKQIVQLLKEMKEQFKREKYEEGSNKFNIKLQTDHGMMMNTIMSKEEYFTVRRNKNLELTSYDKTIKKGNNFNLLETIVNNTGCECLRHPIPSKLVEDVLATCLLLNNLYKPFSSD